MKPFWRRFANYGRDPERKFEQGMELRPGESSTLPLDLAVIFPPDIVAAIQRKEIILSYRATPQIKIGPDRYQITLELALDGKMFGSINVDFSGPEGTTLSF